MNFLKKPVLFRREPSEVNKRLRMKYIAFRTEDGKCRRKVAMYCRVLDVSRQGFYEYLKSKNKEWKYQWIANLMYEILKEDEYNDTYGRYRMRDALLLRYTEENSPGERTVYRIMHKIGIIHKPKRKPNGITKTGKEAQKSDDLLKRNFKSDSTLKKCITDITEIPCKGDKLYVSAIYDCYEAAIIGVSMDTNMKSSLCIRAIKNAYISYPGLR